MNKLTHFQPQFVKSAKSLSEWPRLKNSRGKLLPEIAVAGRSNVGKSSLINHIFSTKNLVRVSQIPGKTQLLNFFRLGDILSFVDLPGYGYAQVPMQVRKEWGPMIQEYLDKREELNLLLFLFDIRRIPNEEDLQFIQWMAYAKKRVVLILTKIDKVNKNELKKQTDKILETFGIPDLPYIHYSVPKNIGRNELIKILSEF